MRTICLSCLFTLVFLSCQPARSPLLETVAPAPAPTPFVGKLGDYWHQGEAEIGYYRLEQARYGALRKGEAVLIQVTEDFLTDAQVKNERYTNPNTTPALKTNLVKRFVTGLYDYSLMTSVFTPTDLAAQPRSLKVTTSVQDWCGQSYTQLNYRGGDDYQMQLRSYFEAEGDQDRTLQTHYLEDELFNRIRMAGSELPEGQFRMVPATAYLLMTHRPYEAAAATLSLEEGDSTTVRYVVDYTDLERRLEITFDRAAPYHIRGWTERYPSRGKLLTTVATLQQRIRAPYWELNEVADEPRRAALGFSTK